MMEPLNEKEQAILKEVRQSIGQGRVPSVRELCARLGIRSTSTVHRYLTTLEQKGYLIREHGVNRSIRLPDSKVSRIPLVGQVAAGQPLLAEERIEEYLPMSYRSDEKDLFALRVRGDSMIQVGILDGDVLLVRRTPVARNGEIVVALIDEEATVKRFFKEDGRYRLQPENDSMEPIYTDHLLILGRVVGLQRQY